jgi:hypothetical protein
VETIKNKFSFFSNLSEKGFYRLLLMIIGISILPRFISIDQNLLDIQPFRQTQTAISVWNFTQEGFNFFNYQTPIFGPPYQAPFELPVFQTTAYLFYKLGINNIEIACRLANILYFVLCALLLIPIVSKLFKNRLITLLTLIHFCFIPFALCWSRNVTIEFCALSFCLLYLLLFFKVQENNGFLKYINLFLLCVIGCLAYSIKLTTAFPYVIIVATFFGLEILKQILQSWKNKTMLNYIFSFTTFQNALIVFLGFLIPFLSMYLWVRHTDLLKMQSTFSYSMTSSSMREWTFGMWDDKTNFLKWHVIVERIGFSLLPFLLTLVSFFGLINKGIRAYFNKFLLCLIVILLTIFIFFNLYYEHDYYLAALLPLFGVMFALGYYIISTFLDSLKFKNILKKTIITTLIAIPFLMPSGMKFTTEYLRFMYTKNVNEDYPQFVIGKKIQSMTNKKDEIIFTDYEWSSEMLYCAKRKGLMWTDGNEKEIGRFEKDLQRCNYSLIVSKNPHLYPNLFSKFTIKNKTEFNGHYFYQVQ